MSERTHHRQKRSADAKSTNAVGLERAVPTEAFVSADRICRLAEGAGWPGREAFRVAMHMVAAGTSPAEAERLFSDAGRWVQ
jgi:hypothetical protein